MLGKLIDKILHEDEKDLEKEHHLVDEVKKEVEGEVHKVEKAIVKKRTFSFSQIIPPLLIFFLALSVRWFFLFFLEDPQNSHPGWYEDAYHHWQVAYLSLKVGFKQSFLRLWDLKGMEYFWGLLHPLVLALLMALTGSSSVVLARLLSLVCGALVVLFVFLLVKRYFGSQAGIAASLIAAFNPVAIYSDASGMQEPLGILMFLIGFYFWPKRAGWAGIFWMLAGMVRAEYWLIGLGIILTIWLNKEKLETKLFALLGYGGLMLLYMKYLLDKTGNAIYPMYWNFLGNMKGEWQADILPTASQILAKNIYLGVLAVCLIFGFWLIRKRPRFLSFFALGIGNWLVLAISVGLSKYNLSYLTRFWVDRIMILPYLFLGIWLSVLLFKILGKKWWSIFAWLIVMGVILASQFAWQPIWYWRNLVADQWEKKQVLADTVAQYYQDGKILFFENHPASTYWLVYHHHVDGEKIVGQMFDPYFYMEGDPYLNWGENREIVLGWLKKENIRLMAFNGSRERYLELIKREPQYFKKLAFDPQYDLYLYQVDPELIK